MSEYPPLLPRKDQWAVVWKIGWGNYLDADGIMVGYQFLFDTLAEAQAVMDRVPQHEREYFEVVVFRVPVRPRRLLWW